MRPGEGQAARADRTARAIPPVLRLLRRAARATLARVAQPVRRAVLAARVVQARRQSIRVAGVAAAMPVLQREAQAAIMVVDRAAAGARTDRAVRRRRA